MRRIAGFFVVTVLAGAAGCKTTQEPGTSATKDIAVYDASGSLDIVFLHDEKVFWVQCTNEQETAEGAALREKCVKENELGGQSVQLANATLKGSMPVADWLAKLPYQVGNFQRSPVGLTRINKMIDLYTQNGSTAEVEKLQVSKAHLERLLVVRDMLKKEQSEEITSQQKDPVLDKPLAEIVTAPFKGASAASPSQPAATQPSTPPAAQPTVAANPCSAPAEKSNCGKLFKKEQGLSSDGYYLKDDKDQTYLLSLCPSLEDSFKFENNMDVCLKYHSSGAGNHGNVLVGVQKIDRRPQDGQGSGGSSGDICSDSNELGRMYGTIIEKNQGLSSDGKYLKANNGTTYLLMDCRSGVTTLADHGDKVKIEYSGEGSGVHGAVLGVKKLYFQGAGGVTPHTADIIDILEPSGGGQANDMRPVAGADCVYGRFGGSANVSESRCASLCSGLGAPRGGHLMCADNLCIGRCRNSSCRQGTSGTNWIVRGSRLYICVTGD